MAMGQTDPIYPTEKLVGYYKERLRDWRGKYHDLQRDVEACKDLAKTSATKEEESLTLLSEISQLQEQLSELQSCLYQEREHVLRLSKDNDRLQLDRRDDKRKIAFLLDVAGIKEKDFEMENRVRQVAGMSPKKRVKFREVTNFNKKLQEFKEDFHHESLQLRLKTLEAELQEQTDHLRDENSALRDDFHLRTKEWEVQTKRLTQKVSCLTCRLNIAQKFKFENVSTLLEELDKLRDRDIKLIEDNDKLKRSIAIYKELLGEDSQTDRKDRKELSFKILKEQVDQRDRIIEGYLEQSSTLAETIRQQKKELGSEKEARAKDRERWTNREEYYKKKMEEEKKRRLFETEGFMSDVKLLRSKLDSIQRQVRQEQLRKRHQKDE